MTFLLFCSVRKKNCKNNLIRAVQDCCRPWNKRFWGPHSDIPNRPAHLRFTATYVWNKSYLQTSACTAWGYCQFLSLECFFYQSGKLLFLVATRFFFPGEASLHTLFCHCCLTNLFGLMLRADIHECIQGHKSCGVVLRKENTKKKDGKASFFCSFWCPFYKKNLIALVPMVSIQQRLSRGSKCYETNQTRERYRLKSGC